VRWAGSPVTVCVVCAVVDIGGKRVVVLALVSLTGAVERTRLSEVTPLPLIVLISDHVIEELTLVQSARSKQKVFPLEIIFGPLSHGLFWTRDFRCYDQLCAFHYMQYGERKCLADYRRGFPLRIFLASMAGFLGIVVLVSRWTWK